MCCATSWRGGGGMAVPLELASRAASIWPGSGRMRDGSELHSRKSWQGGGGRAGRWPVDVTSFKQRRGFGKWRADGAPRWEIRGWYGTDALTAQTGGGQETGGDRRANHTGSWQGRTSQQMPSGLRRLWLSSVKGGAKLLELVATPSLSALSPPPTQNEP